jgi:hypothetical protein
MVTNTERVLLKLLNKEELIKDLIRERKNFEIAISWMPSSGRDLTYSNEAIEENLDKELSVKLSKEYQDAADKDLRDAAR